MDSLFRVETVKFLKELQARQHFFLKQSGSRRPQSGSFFICTLQKGPVHRLPLCLTSEYVLSIN